MSVRFITARYPTVVRLVRSVHVRVFFPVRTVGEPPVASFVLAFERFLACENTKHGRRLISTACDPCASAGRATVSVRAIIYGGHRTRVKINVIDFVFGRAGNFSVTKSGPGKLHDHREYTYSRRTGKGCSRTLKTFQGP